MPKIFVKRLLGLVVLTLVIFAIGAYLARNYLEAYYIPVFPWLLLFFLVVNAGTHFFRLRATELEPTKFPRYLMAINGFKIFTYLILITIYVFIFRENARNFLIGFIILYFIFFCF